MKQKAATFIEMEQIVNKLYISKPEVMALLNINRNEAGRLIDEIRADMELEGRTVIYDRPPTVPTIRVMKYSDYTIDYIRKQAKAMKGTMIV